MLEFNNSNKLKAFMKKESARLNLNPGNVYRTFFARCFLERLSKYNNKEILLKGSSAEIVYLGRVVRAITDIDIACLNNLSEVMPIIINALNDDMENGLKFELIKGLDRTQTGIYKLKIESYIDSINQVLGVDFQEHYDRLIEPCVKVMPKVFEGDEEFEVYVPSFEEYLAEKLCIILESNKMDVLNTRVKDFYDIYQLHGGKYDTDKLTEYFGKMLKLRNKISIDKTSTFYLNKEFVDAHQSVWDSAKEKYDFVDHDIDLDGAVYYTRAVLREQLQKNGQTVDLLQKVLK